MNKIKLLSAIVALTSTAAVAYYLGQHHTPPATTTVASKTPKVLYWYDPMVPNQHFDKPGKSPFMDMDLEPMYDEMPDAPGGVSVAPQTIQSMGVRTALVSLGQFNQQLTAVASITPDEHNVQVVQTRATGWVDKLYVRALNDSVKSGQLLLSLYAPDLVAAQEEYLLALRSANDSLTVAAANKLALLGFSPTQITQLKNSQHASRLVNYYAPSAGVVTEINVKQGAQVSQGMSLFTLTNLSSVWLIAEIPEAQSALLHIGDKAKIAVPSYPDQFYQGQVDYIYPKLNDTARTLQVRIKLANPHGLLKPGMYANVIFNERNASASLQVPSEAVISTGQRNVVIVADGGGKFHPAEVKLGREANGQYEILHGLAEGDTIVISGQFMIDSESNLKTAIDRLTVGSKQ
ncbi:MAG: efflux RND transporter periplasmic adaptor subunit [Sulfuriferula sp.]|nr:efflux RND transporter periplasmic adaptor subunit [Sulfuriferula sp.]